MFIMVSTFQIKPCTLLQPFISCYALRIFDSEIGFPQPMYAQPEYYMTFFLQKDKSCAVINNSGNFQRNVSNALSTIYTQSQGCLYFKGSYNLFSVLFKANGLFAIFGIPQKLLINDMIPVDNILGNDTCILTEQIEACKDIHDMGSYLNVYLTRKLLCQKHSYHTNIIALTSNDILKNKGLLSIDNLIRNANMSLRNFERRFINEVGVSPKLYMRITRFYNAVQNKMLNPEKNWTEITYEHGYYDQSHFIKDCREFSSKSPEEFFKYTPPPKEKYIEM